MPDVLLANDEIVGIAWISSIGGLQADGVATQLPGGVNGEAQWAKYGFITVAVVGGSPGQEIPVRRPVFQVDCWANNVGSNKPPWWRANALAEQVRLGVYDRLRVHRGVTLTAGGKSYPPAAVLGAIMLTEPRRGYGDPGDYARYFFDLQLTWVPGYELDP